MIRRRIMAAVLFSWLILVLAAAYADTLMLPNDLKTIGTGAFQGDSSLDEVIIPDGVSEIPANAFADSPNLLTIRLPNSLRRENIDASCLSNCPHVTVCAPAGSEALQWASDLGLPVMTE